MAEFSVLDAEDQPLVYLTADDPTSVPTQVEAADPMFADLVTYANEMIDGLGDKASCLAIASRMGPYSYLAEGRQS